jgi:putative Mg2+ transporter-C (MgtC) family protein
MPIKYEILLRLVLAAFLGGSIGLEREVHGRPAGIRTYLLLCLGSCLFMVISEYLWMGFEKVGLPDLQPDPGRIAAQAVTGIGFLGAGVIIRYKDTIRGLTTAACVWVACAIGLAIGAGLYLFGVAVTVLTGLGLISLKAFEKRLKKDWYQEMTVVSTDEAGQMERIQEIIGQHEFQIVSSGLIKDLAKKEVTANYLLCLRTVHPSREVLYEIFDIPGVKRVDLA